ncbi:hypothetical protein BDN71DRAFT_1434553 [Pleurotus eryngii]|uniref:Uncharacterized protein n=1 Tax=Pleurotus eryngii TaxID=5323 RepID=A0A9P6DCE0_PLEER|nr:hypothetical protein BDN71DRAFT_1434553 [Pleurotus eryngii]
MKTIKSVSTSTILAIMINGAYTSAAPNSRPTATNTSTTHAERCALVVAAEEALIKWKGRIEAALGYDTAQVEQWIIVNGRHTSPSSRRHHATLRAYTNGLAQRGGYDLAGYESCCLALPFSLGWAATYAPGPYTGGRGYHCFSQECPHHTQTLADEAYSDTYQKMAVLDDGTHQTTAILDNTMAVLDNSWTTCVGVSPGNPLTLGCLSDYGHPGRHVLSWTTMSIKPWQSWTTCVGVSPGNPLTAGCLSDNGSPGRHALKLAVLDDMHWMHISQWQSWTTCVDNGSPGQHVLTMAVLDAMRCPGRHELQ